MPSVAPAPSMLVLLATWNTGQLRVCTTTNSIGIGPVSYNICLKHWLDQITLPCLHGGSWSTVEWLAVSCGNVVKSSHYDFENGQAVHWAHALGSRLCP